MAFLLLFIVICRVVYVWTRRSKKHPPLPPGPPGDPIIGHLRLLLSDDKELILRDLGKKYGMSFNCSLIVELLIVQVGGIIHLSVLGRSFIVLNSLEMAADLLDERASNYSGRPRFPLCEMYALYG